MSDQPEERCAEHGCDHRRRRPDMCGIGVTHRGNRYGIGWMPTWPHVSLGVSAHLGSRFAHLSLHLPIGVVVIGCLGAAPPVHLDFPTEYEYLKRLRYIDEDLERPHDDFDHRTWAIRRAHHRVTEIRQDLAIALWVDEVQRLVDEDPEPTEG